MTPTEKHEGYRSAGEMADRRREISVLRVLPQESPPARLRFRRQGAGDDGEGGGRQRPVACEEAGILPDIRAANVETGTKDDKR